MSTVSQRYGVENFAIIVVGTLFIIFPVSLACFSSDRRKKRNRKGNSCCNKNHHDQKYQVFHALKLSEIRCLFISRNACFYAANQSSIFRKVFSVMYEKSSVLWVTRTIPFEMAVAAIWLSLYGIFFPACSALL